MNGRASRPRTRAKYHRISSFAEPIGTLSGGSGSSYGGRRPTGPGPAGLTRSKQFEVQAIAEEERPHAAGPCLGSARPRMDRAGATAGGLAGRARPVAGHLPNHRPVRRQAIRRLRLWAEKHLQRWIGYARTGHGGNKLLRARDPTNFRFSSSSGVSPDLDNASVIAIEGTWKERLNSRAPAGLNDN